MATRSIRGKRNIEKCPERTPLQEAVRLLSRRPLTGHELRRRLIDRGYLMEDAEEAVRRLEDEGYLDDLQLSRHFICVRAERKRHGPNRLLLDLEKRGVAKNVARQALRMALESREIDPGRILLEETAKRVASLGGVLDRRAHARVYNALLRSGFDPQDIRGALEPHFRGIKGAAEEY